VLLAGASRILCTFQDLIPIPRYDRYWMGRTCWSDIIRDSRTMGRLIWFHVPPLLSAKTPEEIQSGTLNRAKQEMMQVMAEKRLALDLVEAYVSKTGFLW